MHRMKILVTGSSGLIGFLFLNRVDLRDLSPRRFEKVGLVQLPGQSLLP